MDPAKSLPAFESLPRYRVAEALRPLLIDYIKAGGFQVGDPFLSDRDVMKMACRSRTAVRRTFDLLREEGWVERRGGRGTFVGPRLAMVVGKTDRNEPRQKSHTTRGSNLKGKELIQLATVVSGLKDYAGGWGITHVLQGIDSVANTEGIALQLLGDHWTDPHIIAKRFEKSRPDVLACFGPPLTHAAIIGEARRCRIPCLLAGVRSPEIGLPNIYDDSFQASRLAVEHLAERGHNRIGFVQVICNDMGCWVFDRFNGYLQAMSENGLEAKNALVHWTPVRPTNESVDAFRRYLDEAKPTALYLGAAPVAMHIRRLIDLDGLRIPEDLSVVTVNQDPKVEVWLGSVHPTIIELPLRATGLKIAEYARMSAQGKSIPNNTPLPCTLAEGDSVAANS